MGTFSVACPHCGKYVQAHSGIMGLLKPTVKCSCGTEITIKAERMTAINCPQCKNDVIFDRAKGAVCPVCGMEFSADTATKKTIFIRCPDCGVSVSVVSDAKKPVPCPICNCVIDVQRELHKARYADEGLVSTIKYEGANDVLVFKHPVEDFKNGSQLIVHASQEALFFRDGQALDLFGEGRYALETQNLPIMDKMYKLPTDGITPFHSEVYFINKTVQMGVKWGLPDRVSFIDPETGVPLKLGAHGKLNYQIVDSKRFLLKLVGTTSGMTRHDLSGEGDGYIKDYFMSLIRTSVKTSLANAITSEAIDILQIDLHLLKLSERLRELVSAAFEEYGISVVDMLVEQILLPEDDSIEGANLKRIKRLRSIALDKQEFEAEADVEGSRRKREVAKKETEIKMTQMEGQRKVTEASVDAEAARIRGQAEADIKKMDYEAEAMGMKMKGYTYQQETSRQIGLEAMKNGITGNGQTGVGSALGDLAGLGVTLGAMGSIVDMTKDAVTPAIETSRQLGQKVGNTLTSSWTCTCGRTGITSNYCPECGARRPALDVWNCSCGMTGITSKCCPECGAKRPTPNTWNCSCGMTGITSKCCPECGAKRPAPGTWNCNCGMTGITSKCCPECGTKRPDMESEG